MTATLVLLVLAVVGLAAANGANDNFKGVATLRGSGVLDYRGALVRVTTLPLGALLGAVAGIVIAG